MYNFCREDTRRYEDADARLKAKKSKLALMLGYRELFQTFCGICFEGEFSASHKLKSTDEGDIYRAFHCGRRKPRLENIK